MAVGKETFSTMHPVKGFRLATIKAGIKYSDCRDLVIMEIPAGSTLAGTFTQNAFCAAPVQICKQNLSGLTEPCTAPVYFITNTGYANAGTGKAGFQQAESVCQAVAETMSVSIEYIFPFSTGVIGERLPVEKIIAGIPRLVSGFSEAGWQDAAHGIMTTDTRPKGVSVQVPLAGGIVSISGISKGAGMIQPNMATMLAYIATDAVIDQAILQCLASEATTQSFNSITVDSDTSTNDCCMLVATGQSGIQVQEGTDEFEQFKSALYEVYLKLAHAVIRDGEGATKFVTVRVEKALTEQEAKSVAYTIAHSPLVKTALFASDPNWGRILAAVGRAGVDQLDVDGVSVYLGDVLIAEQGAVAASYTEVAGVEVMQQEEITITVLLGRGLASSTVWTTDLSYDYVKINADYRS